MFDINYELIIAIVEYLEIDTEIVLSSEVKFDEGLNATQSLIEIIKYFGGNTYISGSQGSNYLKENLFLENNIKLEYQINTFKEYDQKLPRFKKGLSIIDAIFNIGKDTIKLMEI